MAASSLVTAVKAEDALPFHQYLRTETRIDHETVDATFGDFDLTKADDYRRFLTAHALVLPALETALSPGDSLEGWQGRTEALRADLAELSMPMPAPLWPTVPIDGAARWGALYVIEGSRLGGVHLARMVGAGLPTAYLSSAHPRGGWKLFLATIDMAAQGREWRDAAVTSAKAVFAAYANAADRVRVNG